MCLFNKIPRISCLLFLLFSSAILANAQDASIEPIGDPPFIMDTPYWIEIKVGDPNPVSELYGISFKLTSNQLTTTYVDESAEPGDYLGTSLLDFFHKVDDQTVDMAVTRTTQPGVSGSGVVARAQFISSEPGTVEFSLYDIKAIDSEGNDILYDASNLEITVASVDQNDYDALVALYNSTDGDNWTDNTNWLSDESIDAWYGITVEDARVTRIALGNNNLSGSIPVELGNMNKLEYLNLARNQLTGSIPPELGNLSQLTGLYLRANELTGSIPPELGNLTNLEGSRLDFNNLSGSIPPELGNLTKLTYFWLNENNLTGSIPSELGNLSSINRLHLASNELTGEIPPEVGNMPAIEYLHLNNNILTGSIPTNIGSLNNLVHLFLNDNNLDGEIPSDLGNIGNLKRLHLNNNNITGSIPSELGNLINLEYLYLQNNKLEGIIPAELGQLDNLERLYLNDNNLAGNIPLQLSNLEDLVNLFLHNNSLSGSVPNEIQNLTNLTSFYISDNNLESFPDIGDLNNLSTLQIQNNRLTFDSIEPNIGVPSEEFIYSPQDSVGKAQLESIETGSSLTMSFEIGGEHNVYQWYKDGVEIADATDDTYTIDSAVNADAGDYVLHITNTEANELTLYSRPVTVVIVGVDPPETPALQSPENEAIGIAVDPTLQWDSSERAESYTVQVSKNEDMSDPVVEQTNITETSYSVSELEHNTQYFWRVRASNAGGASDWSSIWHFTTIVAKPTAVTLSSPANNATGVSRNPTLRWNASDEADHYTVQLSDDEDFSNLIVDEENVPDTSYTVSDLEYSKTYYWRVMGHNEAGDSPWSEEWNFTTMDEPLEPPVAPELVSPGDGATNVELNPTLIWKASETAEYYTLQLSTDSQFTDLIVELENITDTSYVQGELSENTIYYWRVNASNDAGTSDWSAAWSFTTVMAIPEVPTLASPNNGATNISVDTVLIWIDSERAESYQLQVSTESNFSSILFDVGGLTRTSYEITDLQDLTTYYWRVRAENAGGTSDWSMVWNFTTEDVTSVDHFSSGVPTEFILHQNYPNPFNPSTVISYGLPERSHVRLMIYNGLGKLVAQLVDREQEGGFFEITFDASHLPSGVYIYRLQAGEYMKSKKLLYIK